MTAADLFKDKKGRIVIWQTPNLPIIGWALFLVLAHILPAGNWRLAASYLDFGFIFTWAWLEITTGHSYFRRVLGAIVLVLAIHARVF